ncbi:hypothetical protein F3Y22_tig00002511pilonHSYRG00399 [Hibiscus syriacus]|uniref:FAD-binding PCMH-type domain-containing protein n=1 Tax=Hibiscus syriacus TaxID=106335 RepID=A0A6A3CS58_HIBSY|nr:hypothetical protein F3Y22_tig00002511pilonHSYRG00399 [Hibiscus syriacus]
MFNLRSIKVDVGKEVAYVQAGATLGELYYKTANQSNVHAFPAGVCTGLGTSGHFSGCGYGNLISKYGLSVDNIVDALVVDVHDKILNRALMGEDLSWAIRGGGGASFGVIVAWKIKLVRVPAMVRTIIVKFVDMFLGESDRLVPLLNRSFPELNLKKSDCKETSWVESILYWDNFSAGTQVEALLNRTQGARDYSKNKLDYIKTLIPKAGLETIWKLLIELANTMTAKVIMQWLNITNRNVDRVRYMHDRMAPFVSKEPREAFLNYRDNDIGSTASDETNFNDALVNGSKYFKDNFPRLTTVKAMVDPSNFFKNEQSPPPNIN